MRLIIGWVVSLPLGNFRILGNVLRLPKRTPVVSWRQPSLSASRSSAKLETTTSNTNGSYLGCVDIIVDNTPR